MSTMHARCTTCNAEGPSCDSVDDGPANDWILTHHVEHAHHHATIFVIPTHEAARVLWIAKCTTCNTPGPGVTREDDEKALDWCFVHNTDHPHHKAMVVSISEQL